MTSLKFFLFSLGFLFVFCSPSFARILFVDFSLSADCINYDYLTRSCGSGAYNAFKTITGAANIAAAGDTVVLRAGTYSEQLAPKHSGTAFEPIIYSSLKGESVIISGFSLAPALFIYQVSYITIQGIIITDVQRWMAVLGSHHIVIRSNVFVNANDAGGSSKTGLFFQGSDHNIVQNNIIDNSTQDNLALIQSDHNLVEGNRFTKAAHTLWTIKCGNYNVLRNNYFNNQYQKIGEIYDCENAGYGDLGYPKLNSFDDTKYNVVEGNVFALTSTPVDASPYAGIQLAGQHTIIRKNVFYHCIGPPIDLTLYADEARNDYGNKIYSNVFYDNQFGAISISIDQGAGYQFSDNVCKNNVFYRNRFTRYDTRWDWYNALSAKPVQIITGRTKDIRFENNDIFNSTTDELWTIAYGNRTSSTNPAPQPLSWWQSNHPDMFSGNIQTEPLFIDTAKFDFHLQKTSPLIDAGAFLAKTIGAGSSQIMTIDSAGYFRDGFGIDGLPGDTIQLQGQTETATIVGIDYKTNTLALDKPLTWSAGQRLSLKYYGNAPDIGAFEHDATTNVKKIATTTNSVDLYPNPTTGKFTISYNREDYPPLVQVVNILGQVISNIPSHSLSGGNDNVFDISDQPVGVYMVKILINGKIITKSLIRN